MSCVEHPNRYLSIVFWKWKIRVTNRKTFKKLYWVKKLLVLQCHVLFFRSLLGIFLFESHWIRNRKLNTDCILYYKNWTQVYFFFFKFSIKKFLKKKKKWKPREIRDKLALKSVKLWFEVVKNFTKSDYCAQTYLENILLDRK